MSDGRIDGKFTVGKGSSFSKALYEELHLDVRQGNSIWLKIEKIIQEEEESLGDLWKVNAGQEFKLKESTMKRILDLVNKKFNQNHTLEKPTEQDPTKNGYSSIVYSDETPALLPGDPMFPKTGPSSDVEKSQPPVESTDNSGNTGKAKVKVDEQAKKQAEELLNKVSAFSPNNPIGVINNFKKSTQGITD